MADIEIKGSVTDIARLFGGAVIDQAKVEAVRVGREVVKSTAKRALTASRAWKKLKKGSTKKGQVRKTARRAYER